MQHLNWNDLRYILAIERGRTLRGAAQLVGADETTVSRRLKALQILLGDELFWRQRDGTYTPTDLGMAVAARASDMESQIDQISELLSNHKLQVAGLVRLTSVPMVINRWLVRYASDILQRHPGLTLDLIPDSRDFDLNLREADIALRLSRPRTGGSNTLERRIGQLHFAVFASRSVSSTELEALPWIGYDESMSYLPQAQWIEKAAWAPGQSFSGLRVLDMEIALEATLAGVGRTLLPIPIARAVSGLIRVGSDTTVLSREVWLLTHRSQKQLSRVKVVTDWLEKIVNADCQEMSAN